MRPYEQPEIMQKLKYVSDCVLRVVPDTERIILFGSYANGVPHKDSDLDVYVVVPDSVPERELDLEYLISCEIDKDYDKLFFPLDLLVSKSKRFRNNAKEASFAGSIAQKGVVIYGENCSALV